VNVESAVALAGVLGGVLGVLLGVGATRALTSGRRAPAEPIADRLTAPVVLPGIVEVLAVLRSSALVLDESDGVVAASAAAYAMGLVRHDRLAVDALVVLARRVRSDGEPRQRDLEVPRGPFGSESFHVSAQVAPLGQGLVLVIVEDRTESRRVDAVRRDFVANVSHELKTPVGALHLLAEAVLGASDDPDAVRRFAGRMQHEAHRLSDLIQELIDLSRLQGQDPLRGAELVEVDEVVVEAMDRCRLTAQARSITLVTGGEADLTVLGDADQLVTALRNLIDNAVNYSPEHTRVAIGVRHVGDAVELTVTDQGIGIPEADIERIFERFYRVDAARSRATGGTGLGLSIVKHIAGNHGGEVSVWSIEGSGSTFTIRLPAGGAVPAAQAPSQQSGLGRSGSSHPPGTASTSQPTARKALS
jgi:two-component system sensor histidine kinase SenX3